MLAHRPRLLVISAVLPFPGQSGQQQRVLNKIIAFRETFHTTFLTFSEAANRQSVQSRLLDFCDDAVVLPSLLQPHPVASGSPESVSDGIFIDIRSENVELYRWPPRADS